MLRPTRLSICSQKWCVPRQILSLDISEMYMRAIYSEQVKFAQITQSKMATNFIHFYSLEFRKYTYAFLLMVLFEIYFIYIYLLNHPLKRGGDDHSECPNLKSKTYLLIINNNNKNVSYFSYFMSRLIFCEKKENITIFLSDYSKRNLYHCLGNFSRLSRKHAYIMLSPFNPTFIEQNWGLQGYTLIFLFLLKNIDCGYSLEPPRRGGSNEYPHSMFWAESWEKYKNFYLKIFIFLVVKFSVYLNRLVFVMRQTKDIEIGFEIPYLETICLNCQSIFSGIVRIINQNVVCWIFSQHAER